MDWRQKLLQVEDKYDYIYAYNGFFGCPDAFMIGNFTGDQTGETLGPVVSVTINFVSDFSEARRGFQIEVDPIFTGKVSSAIDHNIRYHTYEEKVQSTYFGTGTTTMMATTTDQDYQDNSGMYFNDI